MKAAVARRSRLLAAPAENVAATNKLYWWLLASLFFEYARPGSFIPGIAALHLNSLLPLTLLIATFFAKGLRPLPDIFEDRITRWVLVFFGLIVFSMVHAHVTMYAFTVASTTLGYLILWLLIMRIGLTLERLRGIMATLIAAHLFLLLMNPEAILNPSERHYIVGATFLGDGNDFSLSICILLPMAVELAISSRSRFGSIFWWLILLVLVFAIIASSSRGGTLGMGAVIGYLWLRSPRKGLTLAAVLVAVVAVLLYAPSTYMQRMGTISNYEDDGSAMGRIHAWQAGTNMFLDNPILGVGAGHFPVAFGTKYRPPNATNPRWKTAHSMYFLVLGELALPGIITLFVLLFGNMRANTRTRKLLDGATAAAHRRDGPGREDPGRKGPDLKGPDLKGPDLKGPDLKGLGRNGFVRVGFLGDEDRMLYLLNGSMLGFAVAGTFLSVAYYPHLFVVGALMLCSRRIAHGVIRERAARAAESEKPAPDASPVRA